MPSLKKKIMDMNGKPLSQESYNELVRLYLESRSELEKLQLDRSRLTEELDQLTGTTTLSEPTLPIEVIFVIIEHADKHTLCRLARVSKEVGKHALRELYTYLDLTKCPWDTGADFSHEESLERFEATVVSGIGRGILAFVGRTDADTGARTLEIDGASPILRSLCLWARKSTNERMPVLKHLSSVKTVKCIQDASSGRNDFRYAMEAIPAQVISKLTHFSISGFSMNWHSESLFDQFPSGLTNLEMTKLGYGSDCSSLFRSNPHFKKKLSTLHISVDDSQQHCLIDTRMVAGLRGFTSLRYLHLQSLDLSNELGADGVLRGILAPTFTFPRLEKLFIGLVVNPSTKDIVSSELIEWIGGRRERLRWPRIQEVELVFPRTKRWGSDVTPTWVMLMIRIAVVLSASGYTVSQLDGNLVSGRKTKF